MTIGTCKRIGKIRAFHVSCVGSYGELACGRFAVEAQRGSSALIIHTAVALDAGFRSRSVAGGANAGIARQRVDMAVYVQRETDDSQKSIGNGGMAIRTCQTCIVHVIRMMLPVEVPGIRSDVMTGSATRLVGSGPHGAVRSITTWKIAVTIRVGASRTASVPG